MVTSQRMVLLVATVTGLLNSEDPVILNENIRPVYFETASYPLAARLQRVQGTVVIRAALTEDGRVISASALSGAKPLLPECIANVKKWRFRPNTEKAVIVVYRFKIEGLCNLPCTSHFRFEPPNLAIVMIGEAVVDHGAP